MNARFFIDRRIVEIMVAARYKESIRLEKFYFFPNSRYRPSDTCRRTEALILMRTDPLRLNYPAAVTGDCDAMKEDAVKGIDEYLEIKLGGFSI